MTNYLIIGNGAAGTTAAETIRAQDQAGKITLVTAEDLPFYTRIRLPEYAGGSLAEKDLVLKDLAWHEDHNIRLVTKTRIKTIDYKKKTAFDDTGNGFDYDRLLLATGSTSFIPPVEGSDKPNVFALKTVEDARRILAIRNSIKRLVLIGGGLLGLEAGSELIKGGMKVTVVEFFDRLLPRQLDAEGASLLKRLMETMGFEFRLGEITQKILGGSKVEGVQLKSGSVLEADAVLFAAGVRADVLLAKESGIEVDKAIVVNERMETNIDSVYAAGDAAQFKGVNYCIWPEAIEQGRVAGINMAGGDAVFKLQPPSNKLKVAGIALASAGEIDAENAYESEVTADGAIYRKIVKNNSGNIIGCIMLGDTKEFNSIVKKMKGE